MSLAYPWESDHNDVYFQPILRYFDMIYDSHHSACPTAIHWDFEQCILRGHPLRSAGGVAGSDQQRSRKRGVREGGGHREDHVAVNSALWRDEQRHTNRYTFTVTKRSHEQKVRNLRSQLITRPKILPVVLCSCRLKSCCACPEYAPSHVRQL